METEIKSNEMERFMFHPGGTNAEGVHPAVDYSHQPRWSLFTGLKGPHYDRATASHHTVDDVGSGQ